MTYQFSTFEFDDQSMELRKNGRLVAIEPQPARALALLLSRANDVVTRDELRLAIWGSETHVDFDRGLAYCVSAIRLALADKGDSPRFVQTLPRKGYCFIAPLRPSSEPPVSTLVTDGKDADELATGSRSPRWFGWVTVFLILAAGVGWLAAGRTTGNGSQVIAVSVFDNETGDSNFDRFVSSLSDSVVVRLTELAPTRLSVIGNAEVLRRPRNIRNLKAVAAAVRADYLVLGQLQRTDEGMRFITHLIRLPEETHLKANRLQVSNSDLSRLETDVLAEFERAVREHVLAQ